MKKFLFLSLFATAMLTSCGTKHQGDYSSNDSVSVDTVEVCGVVDTISVDTL